MSSYKYTLEKYNGIKSRFRCPNCDENNVFTRYIDTENNEYIFDTVGKCNRKIKCDYHYTPKQYFEDKNIPFDKKPYKPIITPIPIQKVQPNFIDNDMMIESVSIKSPNNFIDFLINLFQSEEEAYRVANKYNIGTSKHWNGAGATVFWQVDNLNKVRSGKVMLYNKDTGKRVKEPYNHINWIHSILKIQNFNLEQCLFGLHLINEDKNKPIAIVESEKTAIISSVALPKFIWLACGSVHNLNRKNTEVLKGRNVVLYPDLKCYDLWKSKISQLCPLANYTISDLLETKATEKEQEQGFDIADYLVKAYRKDSLFLK